MSYEQRIISLERKNEAMAAQVAALMARLAAVEQSNAQNWTAGSWSTPASGGSVFGFTTPAGGLPANGSATCTLTDGGSDVIHNEFATAIAASKKCVGGFKLDGTTRLFISEDC